MPSLGADMEDATLISWKVQPGDQVRRGDIIAEIETDKGDIDVEVYEDGVIEEIVAQPGEKLPVGAVLAVIGSKTEERKKEPVWATTPTPSQKSQKTTRPAPHLGTPAPYHEATDRVKASPLARSMAKKLGIDLQTIHGTGPNGVIKRRDLEQAQQAQPITEPVSVSKPATKPDPSQVEKGKATFQEHMRRAIAAAMSKSNQEIPHYYLEHHINMQPALDWLSKENQRRSVKERLLPAVLPLKAVALALADVPELNGFWQDGRLQPQEAINIGFAVSLRQGGLVTPAIHHVDEKSLDELMEDLRDITQRVRSGKLRSSDLTNATVTLTSLGDRGVEKVLGVIYPPQVAVVGLGKVMDKPWVVEGMLGVKPVMVATLAADHRATDGRIGAKFLDQLNQYLQQPESL